jgi:hypothetical protein
MQPNAILSTDRSSDSSRAFLSRPALRSTAARRRYGAVKRGVSLDGEWRSWRRALEL